MAIKRPSLHTWTVFRQLPPVPCGKDRDGNVEWESVFEFAGTVTAMNTGEAMIIAKDRASAPVLQLVR